MIWDQATIKGACPAFTGSATTTSWPAAACPVTIPVGMMISVATNPNKVPGAKCTGDTVLALLDGDGNIVQNRGGNNAENDDYDYSQDGHCSFLRFINTGEEPLSVHIESKCFRGDDTDPTTEYNCTGTAAYAITSLQSTTIANNKCVLRDGTRIFRCSCVLTRCPFLFSTGRTTCMSVRRGARERCRCDLRGG